jgi:hypothetical protein
MMSHHTIKAKPSERVTTKKENTETCDQTTTAYILTVMVCPGMQV